MIPANKSDKRTSKELAVYTVNADETETFVRMHTITSKDPKRPGESYPLKDRMFGLCCYTCYDIDCANNGCIRRGYSTAKNLNCSNWKGGLDE